MPEDPIQLTIPEKHKEALECLYAATVNVWEGGSYLESSACVDLLIAMKKAEEALGIET